MSNCLLLDTGSVAHAAGRVRLKDLSAPRLARAQVSGSPRGGPEVTGSLTSVSSLCDDGYVFTFDQTSATVLRPDGGVTICPRAGGYYNLHDTT